MPKVTFDRIKDYIQSLVKYTDKHHLTNEFGEYLLSLCKLSEKDRGTVLLSWRRISFQLS